MIAKNNGVYYTPKALSDFIVQHSLKYFSKERELSILEPSCGDGVFIEAICKYLKPHEKKLHSIECIEIDQQALKVAQTRSCNKLKKRKFLNQSFFDFIDNKRKKYDFIVGNPPYVARKRLAEETINKCKIVYQKAGLNDTYFRNLWGAFLVASVKLISDCGVLAYVLPAEFFQVKFTEEIRNLLTESFDRIEIISFNEIVFDGLQQDTILLFCYKNHIKKGLFFSQKKNIKELTKKEPKFKRKELKTIQNFKWTSHILTQKELEFLLKLQDHIKPISHYCKAVAGIVTAANNFFIVNDETLKEFELENFALPIIKGGRYVNGSAIFTTENLNNLKANGKPCNLLSIQDANKSNLSNRARSYLDLGLSEEIDQRYKCKKRPIWYSVPGIWNSEGFFFKRSYLYPKITVNEADVMVTDSAYRIKMLDGNCVNSLVYSFYNSFTLAIAELRGRFYGGGVLELTPNEFKSIPLPYVSVEKDEFSIFNDRFEKKSSIEEILKKSDHEILIKKYGIDASDVEMIQKIKMKLTARRLGKAQTK